MKGFADFLEGFGISSFYVTAILAIALFFVMITFVPQLFGAALVWIFAFAPVWLPLFLAIIGWRMWMAYIRAQYIAKQDTTILEIRIPRDINKSPRAMEAVFAGLHIGPGEGTFVQRLIQGQVRPWWSFELASIEGRIHFYVWTRSFFKDYVEAQIYAQYPEVEIYEVEDYTKDLPFDLNKHSMWGCDFKLTKGDAFPLKTYIDYELDKDPKEEVKVDPIANLFEYLSVLKKGEYVWIQIMMRTNKDKVHKPGTWFGKTDRWKLEAEEEIEKIKEGTMIELDALTGEDKKVRGMGPMRPSDREKLDAIEKSLGKPGYDAGIRGIYIAEKDSFKAVRIAGLTGVYKQFGSSHLNGLAPTRWFTKFDFSWQEWFGAKDKTALGLYDAYVQRSWFHPPHQTPHYIMTTEELATIYHFPSRTVQAPGIDRIPSAKSEAPANLPI